MELHHTTEDKGEVVKFIYLHLLTVARLEQPLIKSRRETVYVSLPKIKETSDFDLVKPLQQIGMRDAFSLSADFSGFCNKEPLFVEAVLHKAWVQVDEQGTEAAAGGAASLAAGIMSPEIIFKADHPFLFLIRHNPSGLILFMGRVTNPLPETH